LDLRVSFEADIGDVGAEAREVEEPSERDVTRILDDMHGNIDPTLLRSAEDDVGLHMDAVKVEVEVNIESSGSE
jgi:hypothetical protein